MPLRHGTNSDKVQFKIPVDLQEGLIIPAMGRLIGSSNISWIAWPAFGNQPLMFVQFLDGSRYLYLGVSRQKAVAAAYAESSGSYLAKRIKPFHEAVKLR